MNLLTVNPYKVGPPVTGANFYGRTHLLKKVLRSLTVSNVVILQGQRRIGKTSLLQKLAHFLPSQTLGTGKVSLEAVNLDIQRYVKHPPLQFQARLAESIARTLKLELESVEQWQPENGFFRERFLPELYHHLGNRQLVILVDEFDNLGEQEGYKGENIAFFGELVRGETRLKWVFAVGRPIGNLPRGYDEILSQGGKIDISFFSREDTEELICTPESHILTYEPKAIRKIWELTHGQPYLTQALCFHVFERVVWEERGNVAGVGDVEAVVPETLNAHEGAIASIVRVPPIEGRVLAAVAHLTSGGTTISRYKVRDLLSKNGRRVERDEFNGAFDRLLQWELLVGDREGAGVSVQLVQIWLTKNVSLELNQPEELDFEQVLADKSCEVAEKAMEYGKYDIAIRNYEEALEYIPIYESAFQGLAEAYGLSGDYDKRIAILERWYAYDKDIVMQLREAVEEYTQEAPDSKGFRLAVQEYREFLALKRGNYLQELLKTGEEENKSSKWEKLLRKNLINEYSRCLEIIDNYSDFKQIKNDSTIFTYIDDFQEAYQSIIYHEIKL